MSQPANYENDVLVNWTEILPNSNIKEFVLGFDVASGVVWEPGFSISDNYVNL